MNKRQEIEADSQAFWRVMKELHRKNTLKQYTCKTEKNKKKEKGKKACRGTWSV